MFILLTGPQQLRVQVIQIVSNRNRHPMIAPKIATFSFNTALLMRLAWRAELSLKSPMRLERDETCSLFAALPAHDLPYSRA
jgi:hypothetical protein